MRKAWSFAVLGIVATIGLWTMNTRIPIRVITLGGAQAPQASLPGVPSLPMSMVLAVAMFAACIGFAIAWFTARERSRTSESRNDRFGANADDRLARIEQTLDAVALEVERIGEMERFATKVLASRQSEMEPRIPAAPPRVITPH